MKKYYQNWQKKMQKTGFTQKILETESNSKLIDNLADKLVLNLI